MPGAPGTLPPDNTIGDLQGLVNLVNSLFGTNGSTNTETESTLSGPAAELLQSLTGVIIPELQKNYYSPEQAKTDSDALIKQAMDEFAKTGLPNIYQSQANSGGYDSSTAQLLANDAQASAAVKGATLASNNINEYAKNRQSQINTLTQLVMALAASLKKTQTNTSTTSGASSDAARKAALAAMAAKALSGKNDNKTKPNPQKDNTTPKDTTPENDPTKDSTDDLFNDPADNAIQKQLDEQGSFDDRTPDETNADIMAQILGEQQGTNSGDGLTPDNTSDNPDGGDSIGDDGLGSFFDDIFGSEDSPDFTFGDNGGSEDLPDGTDSSFFLPDDGSDDPNSSSFDDSEEGFDSEFFAGEGA